MARKKRKPDETDGVTLQLDAVPNDPTQPAATWRPHIDLHLTRDQGSALRRLVSGLDKAGAVVDCGRGGTRRVVSANGAVRWLLQQLHEQGADAAAAHEEYLATTTTPAPPPPQAELQPDDQAEVSAEVDAAQPDDDQPDLPDLPAGI